jgi:hypothetical protein
LYDVEMRRFSNSTRWSFTKAMDLTPGNHTVALQATWVGAGWGRTGAELASAIVAGTAVTEQSTLTAIVLNK